MFPMPLNISIDPKTGYVYREGWPRPGLRITVADAGTFAVYACSFRTGGWSAPVLIKANASVADVAVALRAFSTMVPTKANKAFPTWRQRVRFALNEMR
jgi:hypothetical protein